MKKMVIGGSYIYSGKGFCHSTIKKIRDGGIIELGYSSWDADQQWIEVLENNFFIGFINSKTKLVDLNNYCFVMENNLFCYEKPDISSEIKICLKRCDKVYLISKLLNRGKLWLKIYDKHGFCCYIDANSDICPNKFTPHETTLAESSIMYIVSTKKDVYKPTITETSNSRFIDNLPIEHFVSNSDLYEFDNYNQLTIPGLTAIILGTIIFSLLPTFSVFVFYLWTLGICLITLKYFCS